MNNDFTTDFIALFLPDGILEYFDITDYQRTESNQYLYDKRLIIHLSEKKIVPQEYKNYPYKACGFSEARNIDDYPIRNMLVTLSIKRRRWDVVIDGKTKKVSRDWKQIIAQGTRMSEEFADFLKETS